VAVALSARSALGRWGVEASLKWPNDLLVEDKKVAGVLAEYVSATSGPGIVVGLGVNLTEHPPGVGATDVARVRGESPTPDELLDAVLEELGARRGLLDTDAGLGVLADQYRGALATIGQRVRVVERSTQWEGLAYDVDDAGHLLVHAPEGERRVVAGDVVHVRVVVA
jgi:BirA family biotin operon repressor/biotin-[acetyl-CoA-carboxylase] ligase